MAAVLSRGARVIVAHDLGDEAGEVVGVVWADLSRARVGRYHVRFADGSCSSWAAWQVRAEVVGRCGS